MPPQPKLHQQGQPKPPVRPGAGMRQSGPPWGPHASPEGPRPRAGPAGPHPNVRALNLSLSSPLKHLVVAAFTTREEEVFELDSCWLSHMHSMIAHDNQLSYDLNLRLVRPAAHDSNGHRRMWDGAHEKPGFLHAQLSNRMPAAQQEAILSSDLDVVPLRPYSQLLAWKTSGAAEMLFMHEVRGEQAAGPANTGVILLRNTPGVRGFLRAWQSLIECDGYPKFLGNQPALNVLLGQPSALVGHGDMAAHVGECVHKMGFQGPPPWGFLDQNEVAGNPDNITERTVIYHAFKLASSAKLAALKKAVALSGSELVSNSSFCKYEPKPKGIVGSLKSLLGRR
jgi:hypothetical protein